MRAMAALDRILRSLHTLGALVMFMGQVARSTFSPPLYWAETFRLMNVLVKRCIIPVSLAVAPVGAVISLQGIAIFKLFGAERMLGLPALGGHRFRAALGCGDGPFLELQRVHAGLGLKRDGPMEHGGSPRSGPSRDAGGVRLEPKV